MSSLGPQEQVIVLFGGLRVLSAQHLSTTSIIAEDVEWWKEDAIVISAAVAYLKILISNDDIRKSHLMSWLTSSSGAGIGDHVGIRRAAVAAISGSQRDLETVLEKSLQQFGDQLYIRHSPSIQQEGKHLQGCDVKFIVVISFSSLSSSSYGSWIYS